MTRLAPAGLPLKIDYREQDFVNEIRRLTGDGLDVVFDGIGGAHIWRSRKALRRGGKVVAYGLTSSLRAGRLAFGALRSSPSLSRDLDLRLIVHDRLAVTITQLRHPEVC